LFIDIHTHTFYQAPETTLVLNAFPNEPEKLTLPVYLSIGLHPWHIQSDTWEKQVETVESAMVPANILAVGESGLDKTIKVPYDLQIRVFEAQLRIAQAHRKPMIIHCVRSYNELLALRKKSDLSLPWIFHWFNADFQIARELIRKNCYLSFGHMLFNDQSRAFRAFREIPPGHVFFETDDAGYSIKEVYEKAAFMRNMEIAELKKQIMDNFERCFQG